MKTILRFLPTFFAATILLFLLSAQLHAAQARLTTSCPSGSCSSNEDCDRKYLDDPPGTYTCVNKCCEETCPSGQCKEDQDCEARDSSVTYTCVEGCCEEKCQSGQCKEDKDCDTQDSSMPPGTYTCVEGCCEERCRYGQCEHDKECDKKFPSYAAGTYTCVNKCCKKKWKPPLVEHLGGLELKVEVVPYCNHSDYFSYLSKENSINQCSSLLNQETWLPTGQKIIGGYQCAMSLPDEPCPTGSSLEMAHINGKWPERGMNMFYKCFSETPFPEEITCTVDGYDPEYVNYYSWSINNNKWGYFLICNHFVDGDPWKPGICADTSAMERLEGDSACCLYLGPTLEPIYIIKSID